MTASDNPLAHGIGGSADLPISPSLAIAGAVAALVVSFTVLALAWRTPRYDSSSSGRPAWPWLDRLVHSSAWRVGLRVVGFVVFAYAVMVAVLGEDQLTNPIFGIFYVWWWVGLVPLSLLFGPVWRAISPVRTINLAFARISGSDPEVGMLEYPRRLGYWPAALGLFAFVWLELVYPFSTELGPVRLWCAAYVAIMLIGGALFGNSFYERADPFEVYSTLVSKMSVWGSSREGRLLVRSPLANLATVVAQPGLVAVVAVLFGSTAFDSFRESSVWVRYVQSTDTSSFLLNNLALVVFCVGVGLIFAAGCMLTGVAPGTDRRTLPDLFAHSVIPIVVGYIVAHYLSYLVHAGQNTLIQASDPFGNGSDILGTGDWSVNYWLSYHPTLLANIKVLAVVLGHVLGVIAAHDRALKLLPRRHQLTGQLPLLFAMIAFTVGGLYLLFAS
ncbi:hypothetical protein [Nocardioides sp. cx-173]|uniref:hypothetical protein n=1 Tax=Nocardioides sp. cx-173 TaxID=2898796 RepID=UPI001E3A39DC|nr:hypothetical protein [Nocardioides sp. cx-173]MCD4526426.1 hypothetical protein [Nocardioides sp. cx-173]UGB41116.1 hypothetical protein LQ940_17305 [Nocardioides sp. cx-173]